MLPRNYFRLRVTDSPSNIRQSLSALLKIAPKQKKFPALLPALHQIMYLRCYKTTQMVVLYGKRQIVFAQNQCI
jgi:hypothetical protein